MVETQFNTKVKCIRSDNGIEFIMKDFFKSKEILHQLTCVDTPLKNVIVERKHQHILNVAWALKFQSSIPLTLCGDCIITAIYLKKQLPSKVLNNKSPYEVLFNHPQDHLKTFGSLCFISTFSHNKNKCAPRAIKCVFLDYPSGVKGYRVSYLDSNTIFISKDIIFYETIFPFASIHSPSSPSNSTSLGINTFVFPLCIPDTSFHSIPNSNHSHIGPPIPTDFAVTNSLQILFLLILHIIHLLIMSFIHQHLHLFSLN